jgi:DNA-binding transcriptional MerR regulator
MGRMLIGELAERTGVSRRSLRHYEDHALIAVGRTANGYRDYAESAVGRVLQIRDLLEAGLPVRLIKQILPCLESPRSPVRFSGVTPETIALLESERVRMTQRAESLTRNLDAITAYLDELRHAR